MMIIVTDEQAPDLWEVDKWDQLAVRLFAPDNMRNIQWQGNILKTYGRTVFVGNIFETILEVFFGNIFEPIPEVFVGNIF